jgi:hypothetical protein
MAMPPSRDGAGAVPVPLLGISGLASAIAIMLRMLAIRYDVAWTVHLPSLAARSAAATLFWWMLRYGLREMLKLIPLVGAVAAGPSMRRPPGLFGIFENRPRKRANTSIFDERSIAGVSPTPPPVFSA